MVTPIKKRMKIEDTIKTYIIEDDKLTGIWGKFKAKDLRGNNEFRKNKNETKHL